jgi:hypothetical protein
MHPAEVRLREGEQGDSAENGDPDSLETETSLFAARCSLFVVRGSRFSGLGAFIAWRAGHDRRLDWHWLFRWRFHGNEQYPLGDILARPGRERTGLSGLRIVENGSRGDAESAEEEHRAFLRGPFFASSASPPSWCEIKRQMGASMLGIVP